MDKALVSRLEEFAHALVDPVAARVAIAPDRPERGYWFGGGSMAAGPDGILYLTGRYRSGGDSRTGLDLGDRGRELAVFASTDSGTSWIKVLSLDKAAVAPEGSEALSIEGSAIRYTGSGVELFVSSEKRLPYPASVEAYKKPGTGVWSIDRLKAASVSALVGAKAETVVSCASPETLHIKDPYLARGGDGSTFLFFCHHPFNWSSSSTGYVKIDGTSGDPAEPVFDCYPRGLTWDVAITRGTCAIPVPASIAPSGVGLVFYDGGECLRNLDEHEQARKRPRGYSCEELGGLGYYTDGDPTSFYRVSTLFPEFVSPDGTGCLRYVDVLVSDSECIATWQQSRPDGSQALMINRLRV
ncbi:MAG: hypothetical protein JXM71_06055 [Spirochaetales bacterium]|nr:hypothetical protein [Spirochaetales bacterium]